MKLMKKYLFMSVALMLGAMTMSSCSDDNDDNNSSADEAYKDRTFGIDAIDACATTVTSLEAANQTIATAALTEEQETALRQVLTNLVNNVIVPTYTDLANDVEDLEKTLNGLTVSTITQSQIDKACQDFKAARQHWERSEAFLGGAASDFGIDPTIDSWPLDRAELLDYFKGGMKAEIEDESTILGFHALEFILFRNGQNRKVSELQANDTYKNFESISGADELKYAQQVCRLLKERCFQLQVAWEGEKNASRVAVVKAAGLDYQTENGLSYGDNLVNAYSADEITAVFAHEFAHAKFRHVIKSLPFSILGILVSFISLAIVLNIPSLYTAFGFDGMNYYFAQMMSGVIIWPLSTAMGIVGNYISRKHEYQADAFAAKEGYGQVLISALKRLSKESLSGVNPHPAMVILNYSHPTLSQRIDAIRKCQNDEHVT